MKNYYNKKYLVKRKIHNTYYVYEREGTYDPKTKNLKINREIYKGKYLFSLNKTIIYINQKIIKKKSMHYFLKNNIPIYTAIGANYIRKMVWKNKNKILKLIMFLVQENKEDFQEVSNIKWHEIVNLNYTYIYLKEENKYEIILRQNDLIVSAINPYSNPYRNKDQNNDERKQINILEYINQNIEINIKAQRLKNFILLLNNPYNLKTQHSGLKIQYTLIPKYLYSDLRQSKQYVLNLTMKYFLIKKIIKCIEEIILKNQFGVHRIENKDRLLYLINVSNYINNFIMKYVDKKTISKILEKPFPCK